MKTIMLKFPTDEKDLVGRECPNSECLGHFKIKFGTGLEGADLPCTCPYCGHKASQDEFWTQDQLKLIRSEIKRQVVDPAINEMSQRLERSFRHHRGVRFKAKRIRTSLYRYSERDLETDVTCDNCTLMYAVYGVFAFCPDCGQHNSVQTLATNIGIINKMLDRSAESDDELRQKDIENALAACVSAFDGFGRELCRVHTAKCSDPAKLDRLSFQNLNRARQNVRDLFGVDLAAALTADEWTAAMRGFQKRHLFAHRMGVIDTEYVQRSGDPHAVQGHKVSVSEAEVRQLGEIVVKLARYLMTAFTKP